ncbi:MAG: AMP-binding protein [Sorangiineae bacterium]|nr:AMP-binding protein [Polyangiaceae bacterium]MEB2324208.1 AMP-binding protein [Sorangiineae bacterium]
MTAERSSLVDRFLVVTARDPASAAITDDVERVAFPELRERSLRVAGALVEAGLSGERVGLLVTQGSGWLEAFFGCVLAGATVVPLSPLHPEAEQRWFVETSRASALIVSEELAHRVAPYAGARPVLDVAALRRHDARAPERPSADEEVAVILYTSGTTGKPKGALLSHENLVSAARLLAAAWQWSEQDVLLHCLPLHHLHGLGIALLTSLLAGGETRMLERFDAARVWEELGAATVFMGVPTMHKKLLDALDAADDATRARWRSHAARLRLVTSGSAALPTTIGERWRALTGAYPLERFGMTEIGVGMSNPVAGERRPGSCGKELPGMRIRIVDERGADVPPGAPGEIWIQGPSVIQGYDGNPTATREAFHDGWFKSGDTATWLDDGYAKILGRTSVDILKSGGYKLSALEIEETLREHAAVADVAVVGIPDETWGEVAVAAVIARGEHASELEEARLRDWAKERLAAYKVPKRVLLFEEFPRNPVGKVVKPALVKLVAARL